jgi:hypothetical protein
MVLFNMVFLLVECAFAHFDYSCSAIARLASPTAMAVPQTDTGMMTRAYARGTGAGPVRPGQAKAREKDVVAGNLPDSADFRPIPGRIPDGPGPRITDSFPPRVRFGQTRPPASSFPGGTAGSNPPLPEQSSKAGRETGIC